MRGYPSNVRLKIICIDILRRAGVSRDVCIEMLAYVRRSYRLEKGDEAMATEVKNELERGSA
jgi:hypothetical protein